MYSVSDKNVYLLENGRVSEYVFLKSLNLPSDSEVIVQGFTCNAVVNPILWLGLKPIYVDINSENYSLDLDDLEKKITEKTKVIIIQHTFGIPAFSSIKKFEDFVKKMHLRDILVFEDCAHALGADLEGRKLGTFGDAALLSFGIEKILSSRVGGALVVNNTELKIDVSYVKKMSYFSTLRWLINPLIWRVLRTVGSVEKQLRLAGTLRKLNVLNMGFEDVELSGQMPSSYPRYLPNSLCKVAVNEMQSIEENLKHRNEIVSKYFECLDAFSSTQSVKPTELSRNALVRLPIVCETNPVRNSLESFLSENHVNVGNWYDPIIYPKGTKMKSMLYYSGTCENAENISTKILNLPTGSYVDEGEVVRVCELIKLFFEKDRDENKN